MDQQGSAFLVRHVAQAMQIFLERLVIHVVAIFFYHRYYRAWSDKPRHVVDVPMRVVAGNAASQPKYFANAEVIGEQALIIGASPAGIALLHLAEQTFFGSQQQTLAVDFDTASFQDNAAAVDCRLPHGLPQL